MSRPDFIPKTDWNLVLRYGVDFENEPYLIAAIGWHETHWGKLGAGRTGWILGYGYFPGSTVKEKYRYLENQLKGATKMLKDHFHAPITLDNITDFAVNHWKSGAPRSWAKSVYSIYYNLRKDIIPPITDTEMQDLTERVDKIELYIKFFKEFINKLKEIW
ncbi:hypothetical protein ES705_22743 [subsurface metagenome]